jgi:hypothetical protein
MTTESAEFDSKLLKEENPFPYPDPPRRPPFMVGGSDYLAWFKDKTDQSNQQGYVLSYIVGDPGAGKSHFVNHLDYLFNEGKQFQGLFSIYAARRREFSDTDLWRHFFTDADVIKSLEQVLSHYSGPSRDRQVTPEIKLPVTLLTKLVDGEIDLGEAPDERVSQVARAVDALLGLEKMTMCVAIDNIDEHFRFLSDGYGNEKALEKLLGTMRGAVTDVRHVIILLCCTTDVHQIIVKTATDRTHLRRIEPQREVLHELSLSDTYQLVAGYLSWWANRHGVKSPVVLECVAGDPKVPLNIYPFTELALKYFRDMTSHYAGDIMKICGSAVQLMRANGRVSVLKDEDLIFAIDNAIKTYGLVVNAPNLTQDRDLILKDKLGPQLDQIRLKAQERYKHGAEPSVLEQAIERFARRLNISSAAIQQVVYSENPSKRIAPRGDLKIWSVGPNRIAVKYIWGPRPDLPHRVYELGIEDVGEIVSLIDARQATHGLFILHNVSPVPSLGSSAARLRALHSEILDYIELSDDNIMELLGLSELPDDRAADLMKYTERLRIKLRDTIDSLLQRRMPSEDERQKQRQAEYKKALTEF